MGDVARRSPKARPRRAGVSTESTRRRTRGGGRALSHGTQSQGALVGASAPPSRTTHPPKAVVECHPIDYLAELHTNGHQAAVLKLWRKRTGVAIGGPDSAQTSRRTSASATLSRGSLSLAGHSPDPSWSRLPTGVAREGGEAAAEPAEAEAAAVVSGAAAEAAAAVVRSSSSAHGAAAGPSSASRARRSEARDGGQAAPSHPAAVNRRAARPATACGATGRVAVVGRRAAVPRRAVRRATGVARPTVARPRREGVAARLATGPRTGFWADLGHSRRPNITHIPAAIR